MHNPGRVEIESGRAPTLNTNGLHFVEDAATQLVSSNVGGAGSFLDGEAVTERYYPEVEALVLANVPGAERVIVFDHNVRHVPRRDPDQRPLEDQPLVEEPFTPERASTQVSGWGAYCYDFLLLPVTSYYS